MTGNIFHIFSYRLTLTLAHNISFSHTNFQIIRSREQRHAATVDESVVVRDDDDDSSAPYHTVPYHTFRVDDKDY